MATTTSTPQDNLSGAGRERLLTVHEPHGRSLPPMRAYFREAWRRRTFALRAAVADLRARHYDTALGQLWMILNPLLLAGIYFFLVTVLLGGDRGGVDYLAIVLAGLFAYYFTRNALGSGASSIVAGGNLVTNTAFPRALLPLSAVIAALLTYLPMLLLYVVFHFATGGPLGAHLICLVPLLAIHTAFNLGLAMALAASTVYLRDTASFLPYALRIWLYLSPVLWTMDDIPDRAGDFLALNPLYAILGTWQEVLVLGRWPDLGLVALAAGWAVVALIAGGFFFLTRERDFAMRI